MLLTAADTLDASADNPWTLLTAVATATIGVLGTLIVLYVQRQRRIAAAPNQVEVAGALIDTSQADGATVRMLQSMTSIYDSQWRRDKERIDRIETENAAHERRISDLETIRSALAAHAIDLRKGIDTGTIPPLPPVPDELAFILLSPPPGT